MAETQSGFWTTPLLAIALTLLVVDVLVLIAFLLWSLSKLIRKDKKGDNSGETQVIKHKETPLIEWSTAKKENNANEFQIPSIVAEDGSDISSTNSLLRSASNNSIDTRDLDTAMYVSNNENESGKAAESRKPTLTLSLYHYPESQQLVVSLLSGQDISRVQDGEDDIQVSVSVILLKENQVQHSYTNKGPNPTFKEDFYFTISNENLHDTHLKFNVWVVDKYSRKVPFGDILLHVEDLVTSEGILSVEGTGTLEQVIQRKTKLTNETPKGMLLLSLCYLPSADRLNMVIIKGKQLLPLEEQEKELLVKVSAVMNHKVIKNKKLQPLKKTTEPIFNEAVSFTLTHGSELAIDHLSLIVSIYGCRTLGPKRLLGRVIFGNVPEATVEGVNHWKQMLNSPRSAVAKWQELM